MQHYFSNISVSRLIWFISCFLILSLANASVGYTEGLSNQNQNKSKSNDVKAKHDDIKPIKILIFGDSLVAGYGLPEEQGFVKVMNNLLIDEGYNVELYNGGVSGNTVTDGKERIDWVLGADDFDGVVITLGANDMFRGIDPAFTRSEMDDIIITFKEKGLKVLLTGMYAPINLGKLFGKSFNSIYPELAKKHNIILYPFFLEGVATNDKFNQKDGIHPNAEGVKFITGKILPYMKELLDKISLEKNSK